MQGDGVNPDDDRGEHEAVQQDAHPHPSQHDWLILRPRRLLQDIPLAGLHAQCNGGRQIRDENQEENLKRCSHQRHRDDDAEEDLDDLGNVDRHDEGHELLDACVDGSPFLHGLHDGGEVVIGQDHLRRTLCHLRALDAHGHSDVRLVQRRRVVHAVTRHGRNLALALDTLHDLQLVLWLGPGEDAHAAGEQVHLGVAEVLPVRPQLGAVHGAGLLVVRGLQDVHVLGDGDGRQQVVPGDHHHADARAAGRQHGLRHSVALRINGGNQADEAQLLAAGLELLVRGDILVVLVVRQVLHGPRSDGQYSQGALGVAIHNLQNRLLVGLRQLGHAAVFLQLLSAEVDDVIRRAFADRQVLGS
mmetsp:Transcript_21478/g.51111  ORF Transcript_21478/g.51111 Transcript_21478/m.51111 type:complete len:359 (-) Transcript_21478:643-1719(-)